ncbi:cyclopropane-fatty-acyl-phospholipid synthase [Alternaria alternata]|jgi:Na+-translocating ferredoxin:NAD+ oxidoreductase RnfC subunit|nr:cyclopropane-fatty-acyl-phospholipid synthase [Alternaria alternata]
MQQLTEVVLTPQSKAGVVGEGAGGVSTHSKFSSEVLLLILRTAEQFCKMGSKRVGIWEALTAVNLSEHPPGLRLPLQMVD